ncbi:MAG: hypothetical protein QTN59_17795 [Candidatus Electrothrix communis]|nr:MAG: hypothetical protein QTN59_17795 [Candidatus Electrothrix communis]
MCGICGELNFTGKKPDLATLDRMRDKLISRGPNQSGIYSNGPLAFGHRRLTIIDPSFRSHQPMTDHNLGITIVFNGTIYNHPALREELKTEATRSFPRVTLKLFSRHMMHGEKNAPNTYTGCLPLRYGTSEKKACLYVATE